jgi:demethylmenaquinone methyltransferase/2-methoxy-6-polyprenyl-1,4-benzoquinol methylase
VRRGDRPHTTPDARLGELDVEAHLADPTVKQRFVTPMFEVVACRYDRFTRIFSFGMDRGWKRLLLQELALRVRDGACVLDVACGTGDLSFGAARQLARGSVVGVDVSTRMLSIAATRQESNKLDSVHFCRGSMHDLPFLDENVDAVVGGYALRNAPDLRHALEEIARVLKPGGVFLSLDFYRPESAAWRRLYTGYLRSAGNLVGWLWHREPVAYGYIAASITHHISWQAFSRALEGRGLVVERVHRRLLGGIAIHVARKL